MGWELYDLPKQPLSKGSESTYSNKLSILMGIKSTEQSSTITHPLHKHNTISSHSNFMPIIEH